jgi:hypothetical protein
MEFPQNQHLYSKKCMKSIILMNKVKNMNKTAINTIIVFSFFSILVSCSVFKSTPQKKEITRIYWMNEAGRELSELPEYTPISVCVETKNIKAGEIIAFTITDTHGRQYKGGFDKFKVEAMVGKNGKAVVHSIMLEYEPKNPPNVISEEEIILVNDTIDWDIRIILTRGMNTNRIYCITTIEGDTIVPYADNYHRIDFYDMNADGHNDIQVYHTNDEFEQCDNYLFDRENKVFRLLENCKVELRKIDGTGFFYTYKPLGCSNNVWESYLYKLKDYQLIPCGRIDGRGCGEKRMIFIYRITDKKEIMKKKFRYEKAIVKMEGSNRNDFYRKYWQANYLNFKR